MVLVILILAAVLAIVAAAVIWHDRRAVRRQHKDPSQWWGHR